MSGCNNGVREKFRKEVPQAIYIHCHAHRLNLVLVDCVHNVNAAAEFFETLQMLYKFFSGSVVHDLFMKKQKELEPTAQCVELKKLSDTRWACQYNAIWAVKKTLPAILATLRDIIGLSNLHRRTEARALSAIIDETFVVHLIIFEDVFRTTKFMSDQLQSATFDLEAADDLAQSVTIAISEKRTEDKWREIRNEAESLCVNAGIAPQTQRERRRAQTSRHLEGVEAPLERARLDTDDLRTHSFYPVIDRLLMEMKRRFSTETNEVLRGVSALSPKHTSFLDKKMILPMARHYRISEENLSAELYQVRRLLQRKEEQGHTITSTKEFLSLMRPYRDAFIDLYKLICISLTLPVTSVSCERSFSCLRRLKNYLRNTSGDSRTSNLALLAINTRVQQYGVEVTLDPDTAHPKLILSDDGKQVHDGGVGKKLPDNPKRFTRYPDVLTRQSFSSGRFYFEVQVKDKTTWWLGVAKESVNRKDDIKMTPDNGYWFLYILKDKLSFNDNPAVRLPVRAELQKVGVFVDYDAGLVSFYDVEARAHIYSATGCTFSEPLYPILHPGSHDGGRNSTPLIISPVNKTDYVLC
ncbi:hypothetical protein NHX12_016273 [Muraenolepis orangiensis]|uniref:B30.2/SPRY domain-containing protein n=1 Tax=Muraenolepis orangiensis TaxID=630683 RepID=A0A9Q0I186_9TELE|nr:hypothetical protein NHX12_016273 [Muraenolepis orangiensis]